MSVYSDDDFDIGEYYEGLKDDTETEDYYDQPTEYDIYDVTLDEFGKLIHETKHEIRKEDYEDGESNNWWDSWNWFF